MDSRLAGSRWPHASYLESSERALLMPPVPPTGPGMLPPAFSLNPLPHTHLELLPCPLAQGSCPHPYQAPEPSSWAWETPGQETQSSILEPYSKFNRKEVPFIWPGCPKFACWLSRSLDLLRQGRGGLKGCLKRLGPQSGLCVLGS